MTILNICIFDKKYQRMKSLYLKITVALLVLALFPNCNNSHIAKPLTTSASVVALPDATPNNYWYQGKAEIGTFDVVQERYGELREAEQVNVFVTEDFSAKKQVKLDNSAAAGADRLPVLKLNLIRRYKTGIYDYSMMLSAFSTSQSPESYALKTTTTIQDWCGHVFTQLNALSKGHYRLREFSYFESEGDSDMELKQDLLEDEIWTALRLNPNRFMKMEVSVLPSTFYCRLRHKPFKPEKAQISIDKGEKESLLHLVYSNISRKLDIRFETTAPYRILGWEETDEGKLSSKGTLKKIIMSDYWAKHDNASTVLRDTLSLHF